MPSAPLGWAAPPGSVGKPQAAQPPHDEFFFADRGRGPDLAAFVGTPAPVRRPGFLVRAATRPFAVAGTMLGLGFGAVFVQQAPFLYQVVLGAPIFEELFKFGLALLLVAAARGLAAQVRAVLEPALVVLGAAVGLGIGAFLAFGRGPPAIPDGWWVLWGPAILMATFVLMARAVGARPERPWPMEALVGILAALGVGAFFGVLEHYTTYWVEDARSFAWRVVFHAGTTGLSMLTFAVAYGARDVRARWLATAPATAVHYLNNVAAVGASVTGFAPDGIGNGWGLTFTMAVAALAIVVLAAPGPTRQVLSAWARRLPGMVG